MAIHIKDMAATGAGAVKRKTLSHVEGGEEIDGEIIASQRTVNAAKNTARNAKEMADIAKRIKRTNKGKKDGEELQIKVLVLTMDRPGSNVKGFGRINFNDCFVVNNVSVIQGKDNMFVSMPSYKTRQTDEQGKAVYQDVCYPVTKEFREVMFGAVVDAYQATQDRNASKGEDDFMILGDTDLPIMDQVAR